MYIEGVAQLLRRNIVIDTITRYDIPEHQYRGTLEVGEVTLMRDKFLDRQTMMRHDLNPSDVVRELTNDLANELVTHYLFKLKEELNENPSFCVAAGEQQEEGVAPGNVSPELLP